MTDAAIRVKSKVGHFATSRWCLALHKPLIRHCRDTTKIFSVSFSRPTDVVVMVACLLAIVGAFAGSSVLIAPKVHQFGCF